MLTYVHMSMSMSVRACERETVRGGRRHCEQKHFLCLMYLRVRDTGERGIGKENTMVEVESTLFFLLESVLH